MAQRFNVPPGWPKPPDGWTPPPGWHPDPSWPPAPSGWTFWSADGPRPREKRPWYRHWWAAAGAAFVGVALIAVVAATALSVNRGNGRPAGFVAQDTAGRATPTAGPSASASGADGAPVTSPPAPTTAKPATTAPATTAPATTAPATPAVTAPRSTSAAPATTAPATEPPRATEKVHEGSGADVVRLDLTAGEFYMATFSHSGESNFAVWTVDENGNESDLLVNTIGAYDGVRPLNLESDPAALSIEADGGWRVTVQPLSEAPVWAGSAGGNGDAVLWVDQSALTGLTTVRLTHGGESNFAIWAYGDQSDLLVNDIGPYDAEVLMPGGTLLLDITADGAWTIERT